MVEEILILEMTRQKDPIGIDRGVENFLLEERSLGMLHKKNPIGHGV
jgi:hypothetical protein